MSILPGMTGSISGAVAAVSALSSSFVSSGSNDDTESTYSFTGQSFGAAASNRKIVVGVHGRGSSARTISSVTIGGVTATSLIQVANSDTRAGLFIAAVPTGTTGTVTVVWSDSMTAGMALVVWRLVNVQSETATDTGTDTTGNPTSVSIDVEAGGAVFAMAGQEGGGTNTWSGLTERYDASNGTDVATAASLDFGSAQTGLTVSNTMSGSPTLPTLVVAALR